MPVSIDIRPRLALALVLAGSALSCNSILGLEEAELDPGPGTSGSGGQNPDRGDGGGPEAGATGGTGATGGQDTGGGTGSTITCDDVNARALLCGLSVSGCNDGTPEEQCELGCYVAATCEELQGLVDGELTVRSPTAQCLVECSPPYFRCYDDAFAIPGDWACNGLEQCDDGSDEADCPGTDTTWTSCSCDCTCDTCTATGITSCQSAANPSCESCEASCFEVCADGSGCGDYVSSTGSCYQTEVPIAWACPPEFYDSGDGCHCGCGWVDPDCGSNLASACTDCSAQHSCATTCDDIAANNSATCVHVPRAWTCVPGYYDGGDGCDCGCGVVDPDCSSGSIDACRYCDSLGSCATSCSDIDPLDNAVCR